MTGDGALVLAALGGGYAAVCARWPLARCRPCGGSGWPAAVGRAAVRRQAVTAAGRRCCDLRCIPGLFFHYGEGARGDVARGLPPRLDLVEPTCPEGRPILSGEEAAEELAEIPDLVRLVMAAAVADRQR